MKFLEIFRKPTKQAKFVNKIKASTAECLIFVSVDSFMWIVEEGAVGWVTHVRCEKHTELCYSSVSGETSKTSIHIKPAVFALCE